MKTALYLLAVTALANAGFLRAPVYRENEISSVAALLQVIGTFFRPGAGGSTYSHLSADDTAAIVAALYGGQGHHSGYAYNGGSSGSHLSPDVTAAIVASLYGGHGQKAHHAAAGASTVGHSSHGPQVSQSVGVSSIGHSSGGVAVSHTSGGSTGSHSAGGYNYGGKAGGYHYGGKRI